MTGNPGKSILVELSRGLSYRGLELPGVGCIYFYSENLSMSKLLPSREKLSGVLIIECLDPGSALYSR